jgi:hypothetical protein
MAPGPTAVHDFSMVIYGVLYDATYYVQDSVVHVRCELGTKSNQLGISPPKGIAMMLLSEMVRESKRK